MIIYLILTITITFSYDSYHQIQLGFQVQGIRKKKVLKHTHIHTHTHTQTHIHTHIFLYLFIERKKVKFTSNSFQPLGLQPFRLLSPWNSPGQNTGAGSHSLLQGIFPIQESNPDLSHCRQILYQLSYQGSPFIY